jgi:flagellar motor switch/type III secretory pathway protein FliN
VADDDEKARRRAESQRRLTLMQQLPSEVKLRVARKELSLADALREAGLEVPPDLAAESRTGASAPDAPLPAGEVERSATGLDPRSEDKPELDAQKAEAAAEGRELVGGTVGPDTQPIAPRTAEDAKPASVSTDPKEAKRAEALRKAELMKRLPSELKLRVAKREISLEDAMREAGVEPE